MMLTLLAGAALASPVYPTELADVAGMPCTPTCTVCHATNAGGGGTVTQPFGEALMGRGLTGGSATAELGSAFDALVADAVDSDGDGTADADALAAGEDPNPGGEPFCGEDAPVTPTYGCFNSAAAPASALGALGGMLAAAAVARRRRG